MATVVLKDIKKSFAQLRLYMALIYLLLTESLLLLWGRRGVENQLYCAWLLVWRRLALVIY